MPFLSEKRLHIVDRVLWMLPFATNTDLNEAAKKADVNIGARQQLRLKALWKKWIETNYGAAGLSPLAEAMVLRQRHPNIQMMTLASMEASLPNLRQQGQQLRLQQSRQLLRRRLLRRLLSWLLR